MDSDHGHCQDASTARVARAVSSLAMFITDSSHENRQPTCPAQIDTASHSTMPPSTAASGNVHWKLAKLEHPETFQYWTSHARQLHVAANFSTRCSCCCMLRLHATHREHTVLRFQTTNTVAHRHHDSIHHTSPTLPHTCLLRIQAIFGVANMRKNSAGTSDIFHNTPNSSATAKRHHA